MMEYDELVAKHGELKELWHKECLLRKALERTVNDQQNELDIISEKHDKIIQQIQKKNDDYKIKNQQLMTENMALENKIDDLNNTIDKLTNELKEVRGFLAVKAIKPRVSDTYAKSLEIENENLRATINDIKAQMDEIVTKYNDSVIKIEEMTEQLACVQDNLETKKAELDEKTESLEQLQEKVHELSSELALLKNACGPDDANRKGNSLFAEVDDQRQKMKNILKGERIHYQEMKKAFNYKEMEIRRLKRENLNIKSEIQACSNQLKRGEQFSSNHNKIYICQLESDKQNLECQLRKMEEKLVDLAKDQKMYWVETVLASASKEARDLKDKYYVLMREKTTLADNHSKTLKELAKVRLDSIKLKVLLGRVVDEFKIKINENQYLDLGLDEGIFDNLKFIEDGTHERESALNESINKQQDDLSNGMLNESTIILLGGHERLGNALPNPQQAEQLPTKRPKLEQKEVKCENMSNDYGFSLAKYGFEEDEPTSSEMDVDVCVNVTHEVQSIVENSSEIKPTIIKMEPSSENEETKLGEKENKPIQKFSSPEKSNVQSPLKVTSNKVEPQIVDAASKVVRKKPTITVTRIIIPSKTSKPS